MFSSIFPEPGSIYLSERRQLKVSIHPRGRLMNLKELIIIIIRMDMYNPDKFSYRMSLLPGICSYNPTGLLMVDVNGSVIADAVSF